jgi:hypothetical protein
MTDPASLRSQLALTEKRLRQAVAAGNHRDAQQLSGEAVRLEEALAAAAPALAPAARNIVGRVRVRG